MPGKGKTVGGKAPIKTGGKSPVKTAAKSPAKNVKGGKSVSKKTAGKGAKGAKDKPIVVDDDVAAESLERELTHQGLRNLLTLV